MTSRDLLLSSSAGRWLKRNTRAAVRHMGYDISSYTSSFEQLQRRLLSAEVDLVVDVGANVGQYAQRLRHLGYAGKIVSFEPIQAAFEELQRACGSDPLWDAHRFALAAAPGAADINVSRNVVSSSLLQVAPAHTQATSGAETARVERVQLSTLDEQLRADDSTRLWLKLDVQGFEAEVLAGSAQTLTRAVAVQLEVSFDLLYEGQASWTDLYRSLDELGFSLRHIEPGYADGSTGFLQQADLLMIRR